MRSGTSYFDWTVFKKTVFRFWPLWTVYLVGWLFAMPLYGLTMLRMDVSAQIIGNAGYYDVYSAYLADFSFYTVPSMAEGIVLPVSVVFGVAAAMAVFSHLFNPRSANLFGSLPIRREGLFLTHYLAGLTFFLVPNTVVFLLTLAVEAAGGALSWTGLLFWLAVSCGEGFFFYTLAVFCAMFTGHILALPAFYAIVNALVMGIVGLVYVVFQSFYYGFADFPYGVYAVMNWFTPAALLNDAVFCSHVWIQEEVTSSVLSDKKMVLEVYGLGTVGVYAVAAVVLAACAFFLYRRRHLESAGDVVAVSWMRPVFKYGVALCAGLALGLGTMAILYGGEVLLMIAIVVWGIIGYFAAEMLLQKSFKVFGKWKGAAAVTAVFIVLFLVVGFDLTGYETRVPDPSDVESVTVSGLDVMYLDDSGDHFLVTLTDPESIRLITIIHGVAVAQRNEDVRISATINGSATSTSLDVTYHLKNGGTLSRSYYNVWVVPDAVEQEGTAAWAIQQIYNNRELCWQVYGFARLEDYLADGGRLTEVEHEFYDQENGWRDTAYYYGGDAEALLAAVKEDFFAGRVGARRVTAGRWAGYDRDNGESLIFSSDNQENGYFYVQITLSDTASSTRAALAEMADRAGVKEGSGYNTLYPAIDESPVIDESE